MSKSSKPSKSLVYVPLVLTITALAAWFLYTNLSFPKIQDRNLAPIPPAPKAAELPQKTTSQMAEAENCLLDIQEQLGGLIKITRLSVLEKAMDGLEKECLENFCNSARSLESGKISPHTYFQNALGQDACANRLVNAAIKHHESIMNSSKVFGLFFNFDQQKLSSSQVNEMKSFLVQNVKADKDGLLILVRAPKNGSLEANKDLSRMRAENVIEKIRTRFSTSITTHYLYLGENPPQLTFEMADKLGISPGAFRSVSTGGKEDSNFAIRLNQSILIIPYSIDEDPFDIE